MILWIMNWFEVLTMDKQGKETGTFERSQCLSKCRLNKSHKQMFRPDVLSSVQIYHNSKISIRKQLKYVVRVYAWKSLKISFLYFFCIFCIKLRDLNVTLCNNNMLHILYFSHYHRNLRRSWARKRLWKKKK